MTSTRKRRAPTSEPPASATVLAVGFGGSSDSGDRSARLISTLHDHYRVLEATDEAAARTTLSAQRERGLHVDLLLCQHGQLDAVAFLRQMRTHYPRAVRVLVGELEPKKLDEAITRGAIWGFVATPCLPAQLELIVCRALENSELARRHRNLSRELKFTEDVLQKTNEQIEGSRLHSTLDKMVFRSVAMARVAEQARQAAATELPVLIQGETGTGKELLARAIHRLSTRSAHPLLVQNCAAVSDHLLQSELFGHKRGAFTGAVSDRLGLFSAGDGGTIFLDEISEISPAFQASLLRVLQTGDFKPLGDDVTHTCDVRVIAASNRKLAKLVETGAFRADLYFRLNCFELEVPPLRERPEDILVLTEHVAETYGPQIGRKILGLESELTKRLVAYGWPGNVRELENEVRRMLATAHAGEYLGLKHLSPRLANAAPPMARKNGVRTLELEGDTLKQQIENVEAELVLEALKRHRWNQSRAAAELGLSRPGLSNKIKRYRLREGERVERRW